MPTSSAVLRPLPGGTSFDQLWVASGSVRQCPGRCRETLCDELQMIVPA